MDHDIVGKGWRFPPQLGPNGSISLVGGDTEIYVREWNPVTATWDSLAGSAFNTGMSNNVTASTAPVVAANPVTGQYVVACILGLDPRTEISSLVVQQGWGLLELRPVGMTLEDIFLRLTTEEEVQELGEVA